jgi:tetratricopeptide (TPR) repeat protein
MNPQIEQLIGKAIEYFQGGSPKQAEEILLGILNTQSNNLPALEILGLIKASQGNHFESAKYLKKAVKLNPQNPATQYNLAKALSEGKDYLRALIHQEKALQLAPNNPDGWLNYGQTLAHLKRHEQALTAFNNVLTINPNNMEAWLNKGLACSQLERHTEAIDHYHKAIKIKSDNAKAWLDLSTSLGALKRYEDALHSCKQALQLQPKYPEALLNQGTAYNELKQYDQALQCYNQALDIKSDYVDAWYNKGISLEKLERQIEALECYDRAIELNPSLAKAWLNRGCVLNFISLYPEAIEAFDHALKLQPKYPEALANTAISLYEQLQFNEAIECCNKAIQIDPNYIDGHWNKSFPQLVQGHFKDGWVNYEYRWRRKESDQYRHGNIPQLSSLKDAYDKEILVWSEQGFGDTLQFCRYIPMLIDLGIQPIFEVPNTLTPLLRNQFNCKVLTQGESVGTVDFQTPLLSLPLLFNTELSSISTKTPYIRVSPSKIQEWSNKLSLSHQKLNIGIACSGNRNLELKQGNKRPIPLHYFSELSTQHNLFLIQKDILETDKTSLRELKAIRPLGDLILNFEDSAAICENMDLIISADTSLVHLAGALNKRVFVLLPYCPEWRWLSAGEHSPWYPSATLFRQPSRGDWETVIQRVETYIEKQVGHHKYSV